MKPQDFTRFFNRTQIYADIRRFKSYKIISATICKTCVNLRPNLINLVVFILLVTSSPLPADYLWPLKEESPLTGTFGEFRKNHIHAGIDISTKGQIGLPVYAGESGTLYRIKTQYLGFGKTVYLKLEDGRFLVYAHLDRFSPRMEEIIKTAQLSKNKFAVDIYPESNIYIKKGELIGYSGDSGGAPPHLHLELRDSKERPINILKNGLTIPDKTPPQISGLAICNPEDTFVITHYPANITSPIHISGKTGLAISVHDKSHGNKLGIYQIDLIVDGKLFFRMKMDSFSYNEFYDNFLVYNKDLYVNHNKIYYHLFRTFNNTLPFYPLGTDGILDLTPGRHSITVKAMDHQGNTSSLTATIIAKPGEKLPKRKLETGPWYSEDGKLCLKLEGLYSPVDINIRTLPIKLNSQELVPVSKVYEITPKAAVFKKATISINPHTNSIGVGVKAPSDSEKVALYRFEDGKWEYTENNTCGTFTRFCLFKDTTPPDIRIISNLRAKIEDKGSGLDYNKLALYIDGKRVIAEYSVNRKELFYKENLSPGTHKITWIAVDRAGNQARKEI